MTTAENNLMAVEFESSGLIQDIFFQIKWTVLDSVFWRARGTVI